MRKAVIYVRISQDREGAGLGVERQEQDCRALAEKLGWTVVAVHADNDMSAYSGKPRPGYGAVLDDIASGRADAVLVWHTDRLHRSPRELEEYVDLCEKHKVVTQTVKAGQLDLATPSGRMVARQLGAVARFEMEHKSERTKRAQLQKAQAGKWLGGRRPFGWKIRKNGTIAVVRQEAREIQDACRKLLAGVSLGSIVRDLNARGVRTATGRTWNHTTLRQVLTRPRNAGLSDFGGEIVGKSEFPAIVSEDTWRAVVAKLSDPSRRSRAQTNRLKYLMSGLALCPCGSTVMSATATSRGGKTRKIYKCRHRIGGNSRKHVARTIEDVDRHIEDVVVGLLNRDDAAGLIAPPEHDDGDIHEEVEVIRTLIADAGDLWERGKMPTAEYEVRVDRLRQRLADLEASRLRRDQRAVLRPFIEGDARKVWAKRTLEERRAVVDALMTVTLLPVDKRWSRIFHEDTVKIVPKALV